MLRISAAVALLLSLSACAIQQTVQPVPALQAREVCVIDNPAVRTGFLEMYKNTMQGKGYDIKQMPQNTPLTGCKVISTYMANWKWDLAMYMSFAQIRVYRDGYQVGEANYDARSGGGNPAKFIDANKKITELVDQLFPGPAPR
jgi:hypothetical protein